MAKIQTVFEQCRKEQYLFPFRLFTVWAALFSSKPIECEELKARRMAEVSNKGLPASPIVIADKRHTFDLNYAGTVVKANN